MCYLFVIRRYDTIFDADRLRTTVARVRQYMLHYSPARGVLSQKPNAATKTF